MEHKSSEQKQKQSNSILNIFLLTAGFLVIIIIFLPLFLRLSSAQSRLVWLIVLILTLGLVSGIRMLYLWIYRRTKIDKKIKKKYPRLSVMRIMQQYKEKRFLNSIYLLLIATSIYILVGKLWVGFTINNIFLSVLLSSILLIVSELLIFNYRVSQGWYGSSELEAKEIIRFIIKQSEDIDFTDGNSPKAIIKPEDIQQIGEELGIQFPDYPQPNPINKGFS